MSLSPLKLHEKVPKEQELNLLYRREVLERAAKSPKLQQALFECCKRDLLLFINLFVYQYNPLKSGEDSVGPFVTWDWQDRVYLMEPTDERPDDKGILYCYENKETCIIEKSREMGASWMILIFQVWLCVFHDFRDCFNISRSADAVDCAKRGSLFAKIRFICEHLPTWMTGKIVDNSFFLKYPKTESEITGEASTGRSGSGNRASLVNVDEFPEIKEASKVRQNTASIGDSRFFTGTHLGEGTEFFEMTQQPEMVKLRIHWTCHPEKNKGLYSYDTRENKRRYWEYVEKTGEIVEIPGPKIEYSKWFRFVEDGTPTGGPYPGLRSPWYDWKSKAIGNSRQVAMELDIDPKGATSQFFDPLLIARLKSQYGREPDWTGELVYDENGKPDKLLATEGGQIKFWGKLDDELRPPVSFYCVAVDVAGGTGATPSVVSIADARTGEKVVEYANAYIDPLEFGTLVVALCRLFADKLGQGAKLVWENHGPLGAAFGKRVIALGYGNFYMDDPPKSVRLYAPQSKTPGFKVTPNSKKLLLMEYQIALKDGHYLNPSVQALDECLNFKYDSQGGVVHVKERTTDNPEAARENHADRTMADALSYKMIAESGHLVSVIKDKDKIDVDDGYLDPILACTFDGRVKLAEAEMEQERRMAW